MARASRPAVDIGLDRLVDALQRLPVEAAKWTKASHRQAWKAYRDRTTFPGLAHRLAVLPRIDAYIQTIGGRAINPYGFSTRRRHVKWSQADGGRVRPSASKKGATPAWVHTGAARTELLRRNARPRQVGSSIETRLTLDFKALRLFGAEQGIQSASKRTYQKTFEITMYKDTVGRTGRYKGWVTRTFHSPEWRKSPQTYAQEWGWKHAEITWIKAEAERQLRAKVRSAVWTKNGRLKSKFADLEPAS